MSARDNKNTPGEVGDTGHVWDDDLRDLVNPPPKWWLFGLYASGLFVVGYFAREALWTAIALLVLLGVVGTLERRRSRRPAV